MQVSLAAMRTHRKMSQREAAQKLHITPETLRNWENAVSIPRYDQLLSLCSIYDCTIDDIYLPEKLAKS